MNPIERHADAAFEREFGGPLMPTVKAPHPLSDPPSNLPDLSPEKVAEGNTTAELC